MDEFDGPQSHDWIITIESPYEEILHATRDGVVTDWYAYTSEEDFDAVLELVREKAREDGPDDGYWQRIADGGNPTDNIRHQQNEAMRLKR